LSTLGAEPLRHASISAAWNYKSLEMMSGTITKFPVPVKGDSCFRKMWMLTIQATQINRKRVRFKIIDGGKDCVLKEWFRF
jgi:hypothetical protein